MNPAIGVDVGGTAIKLGLVDEHWTILGRDKIDTARDASFEDLAGAIGDAVARLAGERAIEVIGISAPGTHDVSGRVIAGGDNVPPLTRGSLPEALATRFGAHVRIENDGLCATAAELLLGAGQGRDRFVFAALGTGIGGAVVLGGQILGGRHAMTPEFGAICVDPARTDLAGHTPGRLEHYGSATGLRRLWRERTGEVEDPGAAEIVARAQRGDEAAAAAVAEMCEKLAQAFAGMIAVLDLNAIIVGGGLGHAGTWLTDRIAAALPNFVDRWTERGIAVTPAEAGNDAGLLGAVAFARGLMHGRVTRAMSMTSRNGRTRGGHSHTDRSTGRAHHR